MRNLNIEGNVVIQIILILLIFSILIVYPVVLYPSFKIIGRYLFKNIENQNKKYWLENLMRVIIVAGTIVVGIFSIGNFDTLLALVGSGICCPIALIFPTLFHFLVFKNEQKKIWNFFDLSISIIGTLISLSVLIFTFLG